MATRLAPSSTLVAPIARSAAGLFNLILPHRCARCSTVLASGPGFCAACWGAIDWLDGPACARCDMPLPQEQHEGALCGGCELKPPPYARVHAALAYGRAARQLVIRFKYGRRIGTASLLAKLMARRLPGHELGAPVPLLVPVPLTRARLWRRGFNQALLLAEELAKLRGGEVARDLLQRRGDRGSQRGLTRAARAQRLRGAFQVEPKARDRLRGLTVLLIDDVFTSGATADAAARALRRAGAARVEVVVFARVLDGRGDP